MMVVNAHLAYSGFFRLAIALLVRLSRSPFGLLSILTFSSGILSAVFLNDTIAIVLTPLVLSLTRSLQLNSIPYLLALAGATNIGSVATISGNPQNILIGSFSQIPYLHFATVLAPVALAGLVVQIAWLWLLYPEVRSRQPMAPAVLPPPNLFKPLFLKTLIVTLGLMTAFVMGAPLATSALVAAAILLITRRLKAQRILRQVDWNLLVMFSGLFILTSGTQALKLLTPFTHWIATPLGLTSVTTLLSNLISNVPAVLLLQPLIAPDDHQAWLLLAASSTLAGNLTLFGSVANLITAEAAAQTGDRLSFSAHLRFGLPLTVVTVAIAHLWILSRT